MRKDSERNARDKIRNKVDIIRENIYRRDHIYNNEFEKQSVRANQGGKINNMLYTMSEKNRKKNFDITELK